MKTKNLNIYDRRINANSTHITKMNLGSGDFYTSIPTVFYNGLYFYKARNGWYHFLHKSGYAMLFIRGITIDKVRKITHAFPFLRHMYSRDKDKVLRLRYSRDNVIIQPLKEQGYEVM